MCGIAGVVGLSDRQAAVEKIKLMSGCLAHRGPDADGVYVDGGAALAHRRLSIIDLSENANQPMTDQSGRYRIVFNGEIYNYRDVMNAVNDYAFRTESDTEAVLAAYIRFGPGCLERLNGMFAFAVWDTEEHSLFIARDRLGVKPLYFAVAEEPVLVFASEIRAILSSGLVERTIDRHGLYDYVMYQSAYAPGTIVAGISQLPAGSYATFVNGKLDVRQYWKIEGSVVRWNDDEAGAKRRIRKLLRESVEMRMISDVRLGAFLSGGIDSSAVVGLMSEVSDQPIDTFSVTFAEEEYDESRYSEIVSRRFNTRHTAVQLTVDNFLDELPSALAAMDSPSGDGVNTYVVSKATKRSGIKVALSGLGGDELFAGYPNFIQWSKVRSGLLGRLPAFVREGAAAVVSRSGRSKHQRLADMLASSTLEVSDVYPIFRQVLSARTVTELCGKNGNAHGVESALRDRAADLQKFPLLSQFSIAELLGYTQNVLLKDTDQFSMASALEVREPFFDYRLVEYLLQVPDSIKYPKYPKSLLVESLGSLLPDEIVHRKKMGFTLPWARWMRGELREFCAERIDSLAQRSLLQPDTLLRLWKSFLTESDGVLWSHVWHLVVLENWLQSNDF